MYKKKKIIIGFGTRPELIKLFPLIIKLKKYFHLFIINTGQHDELLMDILKLFKIKVDINLNVMKKKQDLALLHSSIIIKTTPIIKKINPALVIVHGDTTSSLSIAMSATYSKIKIAHIEAGLRTFQKNEPFPEEINRKIIGSISDFHFAPTKTAKENLKKEGIKKNIFITGNTIIDAVKLISSISNQKNIKTFFEKVLKDKSKTINDTILITCHRRENFDKNIIIISKLIIKLAKKYKNKIFIFPVHPNPNIKKIVYKLIPRMSNLFLISPLRYDRFLYLFKNSILVITDSGGIQEECYYFKTPIILLRNYTERPEAIKHKLVHLSSINEKKITKLFEKLICYKLRNLNKNPYGIGNSSDKINKILQKHIY